ncbi:alpha/beta fold hydrolase [Streptomyces sp. BI20]|uniref:alpha/beta fold hydrolase n=1 Tax=Streptomyces sp. BI20 TaxID=3403460 RepID=UPI003C714031
MSVTTTAPVATARVTTGHVTVGSARVRFERHEAVSGTPLVLVHGTGSAGSGVNWGSTLPLLTPSRPVVTLDLSGTDATVDDGGPLSVEILARQVIAVVEEVRGPLGGPVDLLGFSMGATVAAAAAALRPDLFRRLVLVAGWVHTAGDEYLTSLFTLWRQLGASDPAAFGRSVAMTGFSRGFLNAIGRDAFEALIPNMPPTPGTLRHVELDLAVDLRELLPRITAETLVVGGTQDATVPVEHSRALHAGIAHSAYAELDAGHVMFFERAREFVDLVDDFLDADTGADTAPGAWAAPADVSLAA